MQVQKDFVKEQILRAAYREFRKEGFQNASLRRIAKDIDASTGIIYSYFSNKDELFSQLVQPACEFVLRARIKKQSDLENFIHDFTLTKEDLDDHDNSLFVNYVKLYRNELYLLFYCAGGSSREGFLEEFIRMKAQQYHDKLVELKDSGVDVKIELNDPFFLRLPVIIALEIVKEMVASSMNEEELEEYERMVIPFLSHGWQAIF